MYEYLVTADIGKRTDFFGLMVFKKTASIISGSKTLKNPDKVNRYLDLVHIEKYQGVTYPKMVDIVAGRLGHKSIVNNNDFIFDGNGVGEVFSDLLRERNINGMPILTTGGTETHEVYANFGSIFAGTKEGKLSNTQVIKEIHVPKEDLIAAGQLVLQQQRLRVAAGLQWADDFRNQLMNFHPTKKDGARVKSAEAELERIHDDLVTCYLLGAWWFQREGEVAVPDQVLPQKLRKAGAWDPYDYMN